MDLHLRGKSALVTGASKGIGAAVAGVPAEEGCDLHLAARGKDALEDLAGRLAADHGVVSRRVRRALVARLCPTTLPYGIGTVPGFDHRGFNGRGPTLMTSTPLGDGVTPDACLVRPGFPCFGRPNAARAPR